MFNSFIRALRTMQFSFPVLAGLIVTLLMVCTAEANAAEPEMAHVAWSRNAVIYQVNVRQYTPEGTFNAFTKQLPNLKKMGVDVIWLMPIQPIGKKNRKGIRLLSQCASGIPHLDTHTPHGQFDGFGYRIFEYW